MKKAALAIAGMTLAATSPAAFGGNLGGMWPVETLLDRMEFFGGEDTHTAGAFADELVYVPDEIGTISGMEAALALAFDAEWITRDGQKVLVAAPDVPARGSSEYARALTGWNEVSAELLDEPMFDADRARRLREDLAASSGAARNELLQQTPLGRLMARALAAMPIESLLTQGPEQTQILTPGGQGRTVALIGDVEWERYLTERRVWLDAGGEDELLSTLEAARAEEAEFFENQPPLDRARPILYVRRTPDFGTYRAQIGAFLPNGIVEIDPMARWITLPGFEPRPAATPEITGGQERAYDDVAVAMLRRWDPSTRDERVHPFADGLSPSSPQNLIRSFGRQRFEALESSIGRPVVARVHPSALFAFTDAPETVTQRTIAQELLNSADMEWDLSSSLVIGKARRPDWLADQMQGSSSLFNLGNAYRQDRLRNYRTLWRAATTEAGRLNPVHFWMSVLYAPWTFNAYQFGAFNTELQQRVRATYASIPDGTLEAMGVWFSLDYDRMTATTRRYASVLLEHRRFGRLGSDAEYEAMLFDASIAPGSMIDVRTSDSRSAAVWTAPDGERRVGHTLIERGSGVGLPGEPADWRADTERLVVPATTYRAMLEIQVREGVVAEFRLEDIVLNADEPVPYDELVRTMQGSGSD